MYQSFAQFYAAFWSEDWARRIEPGLAMLLDRCQPAKAELRILDVACGAGHNAMLLARKGHTVIGIDGSPALLRLARRNSPDVTFKPWRFGQPLPKVGVCDAAVCLYDSINHAPDEETVLNTFKAIAGAVRTGGVLVFDYNSATGFAKRWAFTFRVDRAWGWCESTFSYDAARNRGVMRARGAIRRRTFDETYEEIPLHKPQVREWLSEAGFAMEVIPQKIMDVLPQEPGRVWVCARKVR